MEKIELVNHRTIRSVWVAEFVDSIVLAEMRISKSKDEGVLLTLHSKVTLSELKEMLEVLKLKGIDNVEYHTLDCLNKHLLILLR